MLVLLSHVSIKAQYNENNISYEELVAGKGAVILEEELEINIYGRERDNSATEEASYRAFRISRKMTVKILNSNGISIFNHFTLPESFDPTYLPHAPNVKNLGVYFSDYKIRQFKTSIKRDRKQIKSPKLKSKIITHESFNLVYLYDYTQKEYQLQDVRIGDEVTLYYEIDIPFQENYTRFASFRIFPNDSIPKLKYKLTITHHESLDIEIYENNGAKTKQKSLVEGIINRTWQYEDLTGCINEVGAKPYNDLPNISWVINFYKYYVQSSNYQKNIPHYAIISSLKSPKLADIITGIEIGSNSKQYAAFKKINEQSNELYSRDHTQLKNLHNDITENFKYENDIDYYRRNDTRTERLGEYYENKTLRDQSRYNIYYALMSSANVHFFSAYLIDNRVGEFNDTYFQPLFDNDFLLAVYLGERDYDFILPKREKYGWYYNEIPFYYENTKAQLVHITDYATKNSSIKKSVISYQTRLTPAVENFRKHDFRALVDLDMDTVHFTGEISLSGQFSTICRGAYLGGYKDPTVDKNYYKTLWQKIASSKLNSIQTNYTSTDYPFKSAFGASFISGDKVHKDGETFQIDLNHWFPHVVPDLHENQSRFLTYYPDFMGLDEFTYEIQFVRSVELEKNLSYEVSNDFGSYILNVSQESPLIIKVKSTLTIWKSEISNGDFDDVKEIYKAVKEANKIQLKIK